MNENLYKDFTQRECSRNTPFVVYMEKNPMREYMKYPQIQERYIGHHRGQGNNLSSIIYISCIYKK